jgi:hypothetical protein
MILLTVLCPCQLLFVCDEGVGCAQSLRPVHHVAQGFAPPASPALGGVAEPTSRIQENPASSGTP